MIVDLRYGVDSSLRLKLAPDALVAHCDAPRGTPIECVGEAVEHALSVPLDFPPLAQCALPGDKVVLALGVGVPQAAAIVAGTVKVLLAAGVSAADITVLCAESGPASGRPDPTSGLPRDLRGMVAKQVHDPSNRDSLSYLAASTDGNPIYISRAIHDADLVISIGCLRLPGSLGYHGVNASFFPTFSNAESVEPFHATEASRSKISQQLARQAAEVCWLLGTPFTIQVVPGAGTDILHVLAGNSKAVDVVGNQQCLAAWQFEIPRRADLVVATIEGDLEQTWENVARVLWAASHAIGDEGAVAICTDLSERLSPALQQLSGAEDLHAVLRNIGRRHCSDTLVAAELMCALDRGKIFLISRLNEETVEDLGIAPVGAEHLSRLAARYESCIVLPNAQHALTRPPEEPQLEGHRMKRKTRQ